jgi:hypothetical protein
VAPSLTRGWVCNLPVQLFLVLARAVTLGSKSRRTHDHILLSHLRLPQPGGPGPCIYVPQEQGGPVIPLGPGFPFVASRLAGMRWRYSNPPPHEEHITRNTKKRTCLMWQKTQAVRPAMSLARRGATRMPVPGMERRVGDKPVCTARAQVQVRVSDPPDALC